MEIKNKASAITSYSSILVLTITNITVVFRHQFNLDMLNSSYALKLIAVVYALVLGFAVLVTNGWIKDCDYSWPDNLTHKFELDLAGIAIISCGVLMFLPLFVWLH